MRKLLILSLPLIVAAGCELAADSDSGSRNDEVDDNLDEVQAMCRELSEADCTVDEQCQVAYINDGLPTPRYAWCDARIASELSHVDQPYPPANAHCADLTEIECRWFFDCTALYTDTLMFEGCLPEAVPCLDGTCPAAMECEPCESCSGALDGVCRTI